MEYEKLDSEEERLKRARKIFDNYVMKDLLSSSHVSSVAYVLFSNLHPWKDLFNRMLILGPVTGLFINKLFH